MDFSIDPALEGTVQGPQNFLTTKVYDSSLPLALWQSERRETYLSEGTSMPSPHRCTPIDAPREPCGPLGVLPSSRILFGVRLTRARQTHRNSGTVARSAIRRKPRVGRTARSRSAGSLHRLIPIHSSLSRIPLRTSLVVIV